MADPFYNAVVPDHVPRELVHDFDMYDPAEIGVDLFQSVRNMHERDLPPIFWTRNNGGHWMALQSNIIADVARDAASFSSERMLVPDEQNFDVPFFVPLMADPPNHSGYRALVAPLFAPKRIAAIEASVRELATSLIANLKPRGECEFMTEFATQMPIIVFLRLLDLPLEDRPRLLKIAHGVVAPAEGELRDDAMQQLLVYLRPIIADRLVNPRDDVISQMISGTHNGRPLSADEMLGLTATILTGGLDTVAATLGFFAHYLAENPDARVLLRSNKKKLPVAIEELIRRFPVSTHGRVVSKDFDFHGVALRRHDHLTWITGSFNFDERQFANPMQVDFDRKRAAHMSFGSGIHFCVGAFLARLELSVFMEVWLDLIPDFRVKDGADLRYRPGITIAYKALPLVWNPEPKIFSHQ